MKFFMEKNQDASHRVTISIPKKIVQNAIFKKLIKISKKTNINGFRKGKVPIRMVQKKYGNEIHYDVFKKLMQKFFYEFINKEKIKIIGSPKYYINKNQDEKEDFFKYYVIYELYPEFEIKNINCITAKKINIKIKNEDINQIIEKHNTKIDFWHTVNRSIKISDRVTIKYNIYEKNKKIETFNSENIRFIVSENTLVPELNNKVINHFTNDIFFFNVKLNSFHPEKKLKNKNITFKIKIIKVEEKQEKEIEKNINKKNQTEEKLSNIDYETIKKNVNTQTEKITQQYLEEQIIQKIIKKNLILIPPILLKEEIKNLYEKNEKEYQEKKHNILEQKYYDNLELKARKKLYIKIIIEKIITDNKLSLSEEKLKSLIKKISLNYKQPSEIINLCNKNENFKNIVKNMELERQAMCLLQKNIKIIKENWNFQQFINYKWNIDKEL